MPDLGMSQCCFFQSVFPGVFCYFGVIASSASPMPDSFPVGETIEQCEPSLIERTLGPDGCR